MFFKFVGQFAVAAIQPALNQDQAEEMPVNFESFIHPEAISHTNADIDQGGGGSVIMAEYQCSVTGGTKAIFMKQSTNGADEAAVLCSLAGNPYVVPFLGYVDVQEHPSLVPGRW